MMMMLVRLLLLMLQQSVMREELLLQLSIQSDTVVAVIGGVAVASVSLHHPVHHGAPAAGRPEIHRGRVRV